MKKVIYVSDELHEMIKMVSQFNGCRMSEFVNDLIYDSVAETYADIMLLRDTMKKDGAN